LRRRCADREAAGRYGEGKRSVDLDNQSGSGEEHHREQTPGGSPIDLNVFAIFARPGRERTAGLPLHAGHFIEKFPREHVQT